MIVQFFFFFVFMVYLHKAFYNENFQIYSNRILSYCLNKHGYTDAEPH